MLLLMGPEKQPRIKISEKLVPVSEHETQDTLPHQCVIWSAKYLEVFLVFYLITKDVRGHL